MQVVLFCFCIWISSSNIICLKEYAFSTDLPLHLGQKSVTLICVSLFLGSLFSSFDLCSFESMFMLIVFCFFKKLFIYLFYLWLCWVFVSVRGLPPVVSSEGHSSSRCAGLSLSQPLLLRNTGSRRAGSATVAHGPSRSAARGILPDQGSNPHPLHWQADSQPLRHQGSPCSLFFKWNN